MERGVNMRKDVPACRNASISWHFYDLFENLANECSVVDYYNSIDIALPDIVVQLQQIDLFVGEVMSHI